jgi:hypothetical protein
MEVGTGRYDAGRTCGSVIVVRERGPRYGVYSTKPGILSSGR